jgi:hypothetical protein
MAKIYDIGIEAVSFTAAADLDAYQYHFVESAGSAAVGQVNVATSGSATYAPLGVLQNAPGAAGDVAEVIMFGPTKVYCTAPGTQIKYGDFIACDGSGHAVYTSTASVANGFAMENANSASVCYLSVFLMPGMNWLTRKV